MAQNEPFNFKSGREDSPPTKNIVTFESINYKAGLPTIHHEIHQL
jgi:hypothetical protein